MGNTKRVHSDDSQLARYPRAVDDSTLYNVPDGTIERFRPIYPYWDEGTAVRIVKTVAHPPPLEADEGYDADAEAQRCVMEYLERNGISNYDELNEEVFTDFDFLCQGEGPAGVPMDRTLVVVLNQPEYFTAEFVRNLQSCFVRQWPLWRAGICNSIDEPDVTIYEDVVRVGDVLCPPRDLDAEIARWQLEIRECRAAELAAREREIRQFRYLKKVVPGLIGRVNESGFSFLSAFENAGRKRDEYWYTVAALAKEPSRHYVTLSPEPTCHSYKYPVFADGTLGKRGGHWQEGRHLMLQFVLPNLQNPTLIVAEGSFYEEPGEAYAVPGGRQWRFQITPETLITDEQLKQMEARGELA